MDDELSENEGAPDFRYSQFSDRFSVGDETEFQDEDVPESEGNPENEENTENEDNPEGEVDLEIIDNPPEVEELQGPEVVDKSLESKEESPPEITHRDGSLISKRTKRPSRTGLRGKAMKTLKPLRPSVALLDAEEERLKLVADCCEYTRKLDTHEDDTRKEMTSAWFSKIQLSLPEQKKLCFAESLLMVEEAGSVVGKTYCTIQRAKWCGNPCLCVHAGSFGKFSTGLESGSSITSFVNPDIKTLQEFVHEWATFDSDSIERKTFIITEGEAMICKISVTRNGKTVDTKTVNFGIKERENLVTEGGNLLLQRHMIQEKRTVGTMNLHCVSYTGKIVKAKYGELGSSWENVKGRQVKTWGIRRNVTVNKDDERTWDSLYSKHSRLILRCQPDSSIAMIPLWFESIIEFDKNGAFTGVYSPYAWACDMELYSKFSIKKENVTHEHRRYILDHPEVRALLSDYVQTLLFRKPVSVIEFTKQYFEAFSIPGAKNKGKPRKTSSGFSSFYQYGSSESRTLTSEYDEWPGEDYYGEDWGEYYSDSDEPKVDYGGLEKVETDSEEEEEEEEGEEEDTKEESEGEEIFVDE